VLQAQDIVNQACTVAKVPAWTAQAGQLLNVILQELSQDYNVSSNRATTTFNFSTAVGSGPYTLPVNWLRANKDDVFYTIQGEAYVMIPVDLAEFDALVQQAGMASYPGYFAVDNSPVQTQSGPLMYVWPPPSGAYPVTARYYMQQADIATPATSTAIPWFPNQIYLLRRLAGEMMLLTDDPRAPQFLGESRTILDRYLKNEGDTQAVKTATLDRRRFSPGFDRLPNTKTLGW